MHFKGPVLIFLLSGTQIFHGQSGIWPDKIKTDSIEFYGVGLDWLLLTVKL